MEYLDEVDENNNLTQKKFPKDDFHNLGKWYREVIGFVINDNGEVLLQQRCANKKDKPLEWEVCTGHVSSGELPDEAIRRELSEEIGLNVAKENLILLDTLKSKERFQNRYHYAFSYVYLTKTDKKIDEFKLQEEEVSDAKYIKIEELQDMILDKKKNFTLAVYDKMQEVIKKVIEISKEK